MMAVGFDSVNYLIQIEPKFRGWFPLPSRGERRVRGGSANDGRGRTIRLFNSPIGSQRTKAQMRPGENSAWLSARNFAFLPLELQRTGLRHFVCARLVRRGISSAISALDQTFGKKIRFHFVAADIWEDLPIDIHTGAEHLAAAFDHFLALY